MSAPTCTHHLAGDTTGLPCTRADDHLPGRGCVFVASWAPDMHDDERSDQ